MQVKRSNSDHSKEISSNKCNSKPLMRTNTGQWHSSRSDACSFNGVNQWKIPSCLMAQTMTCPKYRWVLDANIQTWARHTPAHILSNTGVIGGKGHRHLMAGKYCVLIEAARLPSDQSQSVKSVLSLRRIHPSLLTEGIRPHLAGPLSPPLTPEWK